MFTKLAPHEDVGENVTFMALFIILPTQHCYAALLRKLSSTKAAAATARPEVRSSRFVHGVCKNSPRVRLFLQQHKRDYVVQKCVTS